MIDWLKDIGWTGPDCRGVCENGIFNMYYGFDGSKCVLTITNHICRSSLKLDKIEDLTKDDYMKMITAMRETTLQQFDEVSI
jgi:hypothetical protein